MNTPIYPLLFKRPLDMIITTMLLCIFSPLLLIVSLLLICNHGRKGIFFLQERPGRKGKIFRIIKFKTMNDRRDADGQLLPDAQRITPIGRMIRLTSIDELPQLINVLKGDMSLIGPRPLLVQYLPLYTAEQARRHEVRPGITGWAQVHGRNAICWKKKFQLDVWYVDHLSFTTDLRILCLTIARVLQHKDISQQGEATIQPFNGSN